MKVKKILLKHRSHACVETHVSLVKANMVYVYNNEDDDDAQGLQADILWQISKEILKSQYWAKKIRNKEFG